MTSMDWPGLRLDHLRRLAAWSALLAAVAASAWLALAPVYHVEGTTLTADGTPTRSVSTATLQEVNGSRIYVLLLAPILLAALPLIFGRRRFATLAAGIGAGLLVIFAILGSASIGGAYVPAAAFALLAAALARASHPAT